MSYIDDQALHVVLWLRANSKQTLRVHQAKLAAELGVTRAVMSRTITRLCDAGRLTKIGHDYHASLYRVADPEDWE